MSAVIGVDPGVNGGIAVLGRNGAVLWVFGLDPALPERELAKKCGEAADILKMAGGGPAFFEKVQHMSGDGGKGSFTFGGVYRFVRACLIMKEVILVNVTPMAWQSHLGCLTGGNKEVSLAKAKELYPEQFNAKTGPSGNKVKPMPEYAQMRIADALLIARYGWMVTTAREAATWPDPLTEA